GALVAALMLLRPPSQGTYELLTPEPVVTVATAPASLPVPMPLPAASHAPTETAPMGLGEALPVLRVVLGALLLATGGMGLAAVLARRVRRRMAYTDQSVGMLLGAADSATRAANLRVMRALF